jgi:exopolysaccharide biosynthesis protein
MLVSVLASCATQPPVWQGQDPASAAWQPLVPGLEYRSFSPWPDSRVHALRLDLREPGLRLEVSSPQSRGLPMDHRAAASAAVASFNASFFDRNFVPRGLTVSQGEVWSPVLEAAASPWLACDVAQRCQINFTDTAGLAPADVVNAVAGTPWLVRAGQVRSAADDARCAALCARPHPRTAVGLAGQGRWLLVVLAEGRRPPVAGVALVPLSQLMRDLGADDAINLDGGGSSTLWLQGRAVMARPANEPEERALANVVSIVYAGGGDIGRR